MNEFIFDDNPLYHDSRLLSIDYRAEFVISAKLAKQPIDNALLICYTGAMMKTMLDADKIKQLAEERGFQSDNQLAVAAGVSHLTVARVMTGKPYTSRVLDALGNALGIDPRQLLTVTDDDGGETK